MNYCKCNCGQEVSKDWATGHHRKGTTFKLSEEAKQKCRIAKIGILNPRFGKTGTRTGKHHSEDALQKIREARARQVFTVESERKRSESLKLAYAEGRKRVEDLSFYIDGRHAGKAPIKQSFEYRYWRKSVFERDDYTCQTCSIRGGELQADHVKPQSIFPELRFDISNGRTLCKPCHMKTETWGIRVGNNKRITSNILAMV